MVKSRSFGVEDLRIEDRLWQRARGTRRQTYLLWIRLTDSVTNLSGCLICFFTLACANIWLPYSLHKYFHYASWPHHEVFMCKKWAAADFIIWVTPHSSVVISMFCNNMEMFLNHLFFGRRDMWSVTEVRDNAGSSRLRGGRFWVQSPETWTCVWLKTKLPLIQPKWHHHEVWGWA